MLFVSGSIFLIIYTYLMMQNAFSVTWVLTKYFFTGYCFEMPDAKSGLDHASTYVPSWYSLNWKKVPSNAKISVIEHNTINNFLWNQINKDFWYFSYLVVEYHVRISTIKE